MRDKLPTLSDYDPDVQEPDPVDKKRQERLFPRKHEDGRPRTLDERVSRVEGVVMTVVDAQIEAAPKLAKVRRIIRDADPITRKRGKLISSAGFSKTHTKRFDGKVVKRRVTGGRTIAHNGTKQQTGRPTNYTAPTPNEENRHG